MGLETTNDILRLNTVGSRVQDSLSALADIVSTAFPQDRALAQLISGFDSNPSSANFGALFRKVERSLNSSGFRRNATPDAVSEAGLAYQDLLGDLNVTSSGSRGGMTLGRSVALRRAYEGLDVHLRGNARTSGAVALRRAYEGLDDPTTLVDTGDFRSRFRPPQGTNGLSGSDSLRLSQSFGLDVGTAMNPDGFGFNQLICSLILRMTKDSKAYDGLVTDPANEPDGAAKTLSYESLKAKKAGEFTSAEYHAIMAAFRKKTGITDTYSTVDGGGQRVANEALVSFFEQEAAKRTDPNEKLSMAAAAKYMALASRAEEAKLRTTRTPTVAAGSTPPVVEQTSLL